MAPPLAHYSTLHIMQKHANAPTWSWAVTATSRRNVVTTYVSKQTCFWPKRVNTVEKDVNNLTLVPPLEMGEYLADIGFWKVCL